MMNEAVNLDFKIDLVCTCGACPEQYDAFFNGQQVGYIRLRHGVLGVSCPYPGGKIVYAAFLKGDAGCFDSEEQRQEHLGNAKDAIRRWVWENMTISGWK